MFLFFPGPVGPEVFVPVSFLLLNTDELKDRIIKRLGPASVSANYEAACIWLHGIRKCLVYAYIKLIYRLRYMNL